MGRSRGGLTSKIHALVGTNGLPVRLARTTGDAHDNRFAGKLLSRLKSGTILLADRGMTPTGSEPLFVSTVPGRIFHQEAVGQRRYASARISTGRETWSSGSSIRSSTVGVWQPATTSSQPTTSHSSSLRPYACGCALMSPRPSTTLADLLTPPLVANPFSTMRASLRR